MWEVATATVVAVEPGIPMPRSADACGEPKLGAGHGKLGLAFALV